MDREEDSNGNYVGWGLKIMEKCCKLNYIGIEKQRDCVETWKWSIGQFMNFAAIFFYINFLYTSLSPVQDLEFVE